MKKVLLAGESWMMYTTHVKGFDAFYTSRYETGEKWLKAALEKGGYEVEFLPNHLANEEFPFTKEELKQYSCVILSDIGANTLLLPGATFDASTKMPNRVNLIRDYVMDGGALVMVGGYMSFSGIDAKGIENEQEADHCDERQCKDFHFGISIDKVCDGIYEDHHDEHSDYDGNDHDDEMLCKADGRDDGIDREHDVHDHDGPNRARQSDLPRLRIRARFDFLVFERHHIQKLDNALVNQIRSANE